MKKLLEMFSVKKENHLTSQALELDLMPITTILDLVSTGDLSQRISTSELENSTQIQQLAKKINILIDNYESAYKGTALEYIKDLSATNEDLKTFFDQNKGLTSINFHYSPITLHFHQTNCPLPPTICLPTIPDHPKSTDKRLTTKVNSSLSAFPMPYIYKEHMAACVNPTP